MTELIDRPMLDFLLHDWLRLDGLLEREVFSAHSRDGVGAMLDTAEKIATSHFLPFFKKADREEPYQDEAGAHVIPEVRGAILAYADAGFAAAPFPESLGGLGVPFLVHNAAMAYFNAANIPLAAYNLLSVGKSKPSCPRSSPAPGPARWRSPSRRPAPRWPTSPRAPWPMARIRSARAIA